MRNLPARLNPDRATGKALAEIRTSMFLERANHEAARELALARLTDIGMATRHGLYEGHEIVRDLVAYIEADPIGSKALAGIAETGIRGLERELRDLIEGR